MCHHIIRKTSFLDKSENHLSFRGQKNLKLNQRKQLTDTTNTKVILILELSNKVFKAVIIKILKQEITNMFETNRRFSLNKEIESIKKNHIEILELNIKYLK